MKIIVMLVGVMAFLAGAGFLAFAFLVPYGFTLPLPRTAGEIFSLLGPAGSYSVASYYAVMAVACFVCSLLCAYVARGLSTEE